MPGVVREGVIVALGAVLVALLAQAAVPAGPVPITLQTFGVLVVACGLGSARGAAAMGLYLAAGLAGAPVFAFGMAGPGVLAGPTAGYLVGFVPAAWVLGRLAERGWDRSVWWALIAMGAAHGVIFAFGLGWLFVLTSGIAGGLAPEGVTAAAVPSVGLFPFVPGAVAKTAAAAALLPASWKLLRRRG